MAQRHCCPFLPPFRFLLTSFAHWMRSRERPWKGRITIGVEWKHLPGTSRRYKRHSLLFPFLPRDKGALWNDRPKYSQPLTAWRTAGRKEPETTWQELDVLLPKILSGTSVITTKPIPWRYYVRKNQLSITIRECHWIEKCLAAVLSAPHSRSFI